MPTLPQLSSNAMLSDPPAKIEDSHSKVASSLRDEDCIYNVASESRGQDGDADKLEPIAVVGMALKFPQDATSVESFWQMLADGRSAKTDVPPERFNIDGFHRAVGTKSGQVTARGGHFIQDDVAAFDAPFFSITPNEASCLDPTQRWLLETSYKALEDAGMPIETVHGSKTSVYVGAIAGDYQYMLSRDIRHDRQYKAIGISQSILSNRLSWFYNFTGPSMTIDTACSSSLIAFDLACQSLRSGTSKMALVGGCNMYFDPELSIGLADLNFLSPDSTCYSFDHRANGYARGEGIGVLVLKPLSKALEDSDTIRAVIRATGTSHNGRTPGLTQPSREAQEKSIRDTYLAGGLEPRKTMFVEAHGTGTSLGDPIEAAAIGSALRDEDRLQPLFVGAVKTNIGHLEGASGIAGVIKTVLVLEKAVIPPNIWFDQVNPQIDLKRLRIKFPLEQNVWPTDGLRRASVNSSGFGGANAHIVLDDAYNYLRLRNLEGRHNTRKTLPSTDSLIRVSDQHSKKINGESHAQRSPSKARPRLLVWSAADSDGLKRLYAAYLAHLETVPSYEIDDCYFADLAWTLSEKRSHLPWKSFEVTDSVANLQHVLVNTTPKLFRSQNIPKVGFVFTGQGAQWCGMGRELLEYQIFRDSLRDADACFRNLGCPWSLLDEILREGPHSSLDDAACSQPACTALQIALVDLLRSWGVTPAAVIGHSSGEIAAGYCIGGLSRESAWKIAYYRGLVTASLIATSGVPGSMLAVGASEAKVRLYIDKISSKGDHLSIGCINSPQNVTVSGRVDLLASLHKLLEEDTVFNRYLNVNVAYHSKQMDAVAASYRSLIENISTGTPLQAETTMFSSVSGLKVSAKDISNSQYWVANLVSPVVFLDALTNLCPKEVPGKFERASYKGLRLNHVIEIGPHAALRGPIKDYIDTMSPPLKFTYDSVLVRGQSALNTMITALGHLHCLGQPLDIAAINSSMEPLPPRKMLLNLPSYPFNHSKKYWVEGRVSKSFRSRAVQYHELLGTRVSDWNPLNARWQHFIRLAESPWLEDHKVNGTIVYPAAGILSMVIEAARQLFGASLGTSTYVFKQVVIHKALLVPLGDGGVEIQLQLCPSRQPRGHFANWNEFRLYAFENDAWSEVSQGFIAVRYDDVPDVEFQQIQKVYQQGAERCSIECFSGSLYRFLDAHGINFGPSFRGLKDIRVNVSGEAIATSNLIAWQTRVAEVDIQPHVIHPIALDAVLQAVYPALSQGARKPVATMIPTAIPSLSIFCRDSLVSVGDPKSIDVTGDLKIYATAKFRGLRNSKMSVTAVHSESNRPFMTATIECTSASGIQKRMQDKDLDNHRCFYMDWKPDLDFLDAYSVLSYCSSRVCGTANVHSRMLEEKELICYIGLQQLSDTKFPSDVVIDRPHIQRYLGWIDHRLAKISPENDAICTARLRHFINDEYSLECLYRKIEDSDTEGKLILRVARSLSRIICGEVDVLELLFGDNLMNDYYEQSHRLSEGFRDLVPYLDALAHKKPDSRILEIGAGTGGATQQLLETLTSHESTKSSSARLSEYVFTDISPEFFENARMKYRGLQNLMSFATLNIEKDPLEQGFESEIYDVVVASNVLHATKNLRSTLQNTRKLLKPGGKLILAENTNPDDFLSGFIFGLFPGWWLGEEDHRKWGPLLDKEGWDACLSSCGFSGIDLALPSEKTDTEISILISTALEANLGTSAHNLDNAIIQSGENSVLQPSISTEVVILVDPGSQLQSTLATNLIASMKSVSEAHFRIVTFPNEVARISEQAICIFLPEFERPVLYEMNTEEYAACQHMTSSAARLLWVTKASGGVYDPTRAMATGLARSLATENSSQSYVTLALESSEDSALTIQHISKVVHSMLTTDREDLETEYLEIHGRLCINRVLRSEVLDGHIAQKTEQLCAEKAPLRDDPSRRLGLTMDSPGLLDTLQFSDVEVQGPLPPGCLEIEVKAAGVNFRDVMIALGYDVGDSLGFECSGVVTQTAGTTSFQVGDRVVCIVEGAFATSVRCEEYAAAKIPDNMTFATAAAFPVAFLTAYYSIVRLARMRHGESILIHSAAGGFGQACIQTANLVNAEIYATVGNEDKKRFLIEVYDIKADHIFSSRTPDFAPEIQRLTQGRGVDVIVNSLAGEALKTTWGCIAPFGRFLEVGKTEFSSELPMLPFSKGASFIGVDLVHVRDREHQLFHECLMATMELIAGGKFTVQNPLKAYDASQIITAFRDLESGKSIGKSVITLEDTDIVKVVPSKEPKYSFDENYSYIIAGGLGGLGRSIARWMVSRNAKNLILLSRTTVHSPEVKVFLKELREKGANVATPACDIGHREKLASALASCGHFPEVKGCIQAAMVIKSNLFPNMSLEDFRAATGPKVKGSWNLHTLLPSRMDFFIMLSSIAGVIGSGGMANYACGNTYQDALVQHRITRKEKATSLDLCNIEDVGYMVENDISPDLLASRDSSVLTEPELLALLDYHCDPDLPLLSPVQGQVVVGIQPLNDFKARNISEGFALNRPMFRTIRQNPLVPHNTGAATTTKDSDADAPLDVTALIRKAESLDEAARVVVDGIRIKLSRLLAVGKENVDAGRTIATYGVDSLSAVEMRTWFRNVVGAEVTTFEILGNESIAKLSEVVAARSRYVKASVNGEGE